MAKTKDDVEEEVEAVKPEKVAAETEKKNAAALADFSWAVSLNKLTRAKAYVKSETPELKGKDLENAVKERYVALHGLLRNEQPIRGKKIGGTVVNVADNDGSKD